MSTNRGAVQGWFFEEIGGKKMCDCSLHTFRNRIAHDGEQLVAHRFWSGCIGFISARGRHLDETAGASLCREYQNKRSASPESPGWTRSLSCVAPRQSLPRQRCAAASHETSLHEWAKANTSTTSRPDHSVRNRRLKAQDRGLSFRLRAKFEPSPPWDSHLR